MKKTILFSLIFFSFQAVFAQSDKYISAMKQNIQQLEQVTVKNNYDELANNFARIGDAEKTQWLPYYYAAYLNALHGITEQDAGKKDQYADQASALLDKAIKILNTDNSEIEVIKGMIATAHMTADPSNRYMTYGQEISKDFKKSEKLDSTNPRPVLLQAQNLFYTPENFGGGKDAAEPLFKKAQRLFEAFIPASKISPDWGKSSLEYFMKNYQ